MAISIHHKEDLLKKTFDKTIKIKVALEKRNNLPGDTNNLPVTEMFRSKIKMCKMITISDKP